MPQARPIGLKAALILAVAAQLSVNAGSGFAVRAFDLASPAAMVVFRNGLSALVLLVVFRPRLRGISREGWRATIAYGLSMVVMNSFFYEAIDLIPVGPAVTMEMLGPLALSVVLVRRWRAWLWAALALAGVATLSGFSLAGVNVLGTVFILIAGAAWACYILAARWVGRCWPSGDGLAIGLAVAALASLPRGLPDLIAPAVTLEAVGWGALVALLGTLVPYGLEMVALRGMSAATFGVTSALAPASAALFGWMIAGQGMDWWAAGGMVLVMAASAGAARDEALGRAL
ncbi:MAG: EamA family transporter [Bifidobacteriaceae bacterium]|nr:EamA family transporter [Bifidobacteriaceae bacterium]